VGKTTKFKVTYITYSGPYISIIKKCALTKVLEHNISKLNKLQILLPW